MATTVLPPALADYPRTPLIYPESDGKPMADNTLQWDWIATIKGGLALLFADRPDVFVAGDLLWYPVEGDPTISAAPDALVVFGRPPGYRGSYLQWKEDNLPPQVAFEVLSPSNSGREMDLKRAFYEHFGVLEYYVFDPGYPEKSPLPPGPERLEGWVRDDSGQKFRRVRQMAGWRSPRLGIIFEFAPDEELRLIRPDGRPFETILQLGQRAEQERQRAERLAARLERLQAQLRTAGLEPENGGGAEVS